MMLKRGWGDNGASMYETKYGEALPTGVGYNPSTDQCYALESFYGSSGSNSGSYSQNNSSFNSYVLDVTHLIKQIIRSVDIIISRLQHL